MRAWNYDETRQKIIVDQNTISLSLSLASSVFQCVYYSFECICCVSEYECCSSFLLNLNFWFCCCTEISSQVGAIRMSMVDKPAHLLLKFHVAETKEMKFQQQRARACVYS